MKPFFSALNAYACIVISVFAIVILSIIGALFDKKSPTMVGSTEDVDPKEASKVAAAVFGAVGVYGVFLVFCASQAWLNHRESRRGAIALS